jgi:putative exporter of polyketide antibiotics
MYVAIIIHTFVMIFAFVLMAFFEVTNNTYTDKEEGHEGEIQISEMSRFGKVLFAILTALDLFMLAMGLFVILSQISRSSFSISMAFSMAFNFDVEFSVDIFQILAALLIPVDLIGEILKKLKGMQRIKGSQRAEGDAEDQRR